MTFALSSPDFEKSLSSELSALQQSGELVDMTIAADGHLVRVHRVVLASASPYLKEIITTTSCAQPVIFLNNVSYSTLCSLLQYIYTGEVQLPLEHMKDVLEAGNALHIRGLEDMKFHSTYDTFSEQNVKNHNNDHMNTETGPMEDDGDSFAQSTFDNPTDSASDQDETFDSKDVKPSTKSTTKCGRTSAGAGAGVGTEGGRSASIQYTLSNRGSLQMILNRYMYYAKYCSKLSGLRQWRCVDYIDNHCPALVVTKDETVLKRTAAHNHPYHDKRILKKTNAGAVFTTLHAAEEQEQTKKKQPQIIHSETIKGQEMGTDDFNVE